MNTVINVRCMVYRTKEAMLWGALLTATAEDGREIKEIQHGIIDPTLTKNVGELIAITRSLWCVRPEFRKTMEVILSFSPGYATMMLDRNADGLWTAVAKSNLDYVETLRAAAGQYPRLKVRKLDINSKQYKELSDVLRKQVPNVGMGTGQAVS